MEQRSSKAVIFMPSGVNMANMGSMEKSVKLGAFLVDSDSVFWQGSLAPHAL
jgi:hypothetical protein